MKEMKVKYAAGVLTAAGWRQVEVTALADKVSDKMIKIIKVLDVDGHGTTGHASRTGAKRQTFSVYFLAKSQEGKRKRFSSVELIAD